MWNHPGVKMNHLNCHVFDHRVYLVGPAYARLARELVSFFKRTSWTTLRVRHRGRVEGSIEGTTMATARAPMATRAFDARAGLGARGNARRARARARDFSLGARRFGAFPGTAPAGTVTGRATRATGRARSAVLVFARGDVAEGDPTAPRRLKIFSVNDGARAPPLARISNVAHSRQPGAYLFFALFAGTRAGALDARARRAMDAPLERLDPRAETTPVSRDRLLTACHPLAATARSPPPPSSLASPFSRENATLAPRRSPGGRRTQKKHRRVPRPRLLWPPRRR